jgi:hypothetical protein
LSSHPIGYLITHVFHSPLVCATPLIFFCIFGPLGRFRTAALWRRALLGSLLALERRRIAHPKAQDYAYFQGLQQRIAIGEMAFHDQLALQKT